jgi:hypothetical protein
MNYFRFGVSLEQAPVPMVAFIDRFGISTEPGTDSLFDT